LTGESQSSIINIGLMRKGNISMVLTRKKRIALCSKTAEGLVQTIMHSRMEIGESEINEYLDGYPEDTVSSAVREYGLDISQNSSFIAWPVFLGTGAVKEINICSLNFGALTLFEEGMSYEDAKNGYKFDYINAALNTIVVTSKVEKKNGKNLRYWPTHLDITNRGELGTANQCSLTLATLNKFEFLSRKSLVNARTLSEEELRNRFRFVIECINWILDLQISNKNFVGAWSYSEGAKEQHSEKEILSAVLPSQFCYEMLVRYSRLFMATTKNKEIVNEIDPELFDNIERACRMYEQWINCQQQRDGGYRKNSNIEETSFAFSCCAMMTYVYDRNFNVQVLKNLLKYLIRNNKGFRLKYEEVTDSYRYLFKVRKDEKCAQKTHEDYREDIYEIFPETLFIINSCKNIENGTMERVGWYTRMKIRYINYVALKKIVSRIESIGIGAAGNQVVIRGRHPMRERWYPIYALYYSKICMDRFKKNDLLPRNQRKKYIEVPLFGYDAGGWFGIFLLVLLVLSVFLIVMYLWTGLTGFVDFILTTIVTMILSLAGKIISEQKEKRA